MTTAKGNAHLTYACLGVFAMLLPTLVLVTATTIMAANRRRCKKRMGGGSVPWWIPLASLPYPLWGLAKELAHLLVIKTSTQEDKRGQIKKLLLVLGAVDTAFEILPMVCERHNSSTALAFLGIYCAY